MKDSNLVLTHFWNGSYKEERLMRNRWMEDQEIDDDRWNFSIVMVAKRLVKYLNNLLLNSMSL